MIGMGQHISSMRLDATTHEKRHWIAALLETRHRFYGHHPTFIGIETTNFEEEDTLWVALACNRANALHSLLIDGIHVSSRDAIGNHQRIDAELPHLMLHVFAYCTQRRDKTQTPPVDAMQRHQTIEIPEHEHFVAHT